MAGVERLLRKYDLIWMWDLGEGEREKWKISIESRVREFEEKEWKRGMEQKSKLEDYRLLKSNLIIERYLMIPSNSIDRRYYTQLRIGA